MRFKGQAFETMMLVISVIVALAILGVLLNILGGINFGVGDPAGVMKDGLKQIQSSGYGVTPAKKVTFEKGTVIYRKSVIQDIPIQEGELTFSCPAGGTSTVCGAGKITATTTITAGARLEAFVVVCGNSDTPQYCIGIGRDAAGATTACTTACHLS